MTCIVGIEHAGGVTIGGDSAGSGGTQLAIRADEKVFVRDGYIFGFTSSYRMGQLLRYRADLPDPSKQRDLDRFVATAFVDAVRKAFTDGGYMQTTNGREEAGTFLVGVKGKLYAIYSNHQFERTVSGFNSVGCGDDLAIGSLHTTDTLRIKDPVRRARLALTAAASASTGVAAPFRIRTLANA